VKHLNAIKLFSMDKILLKRKVLIHFMKLNLLLHTSKYSYRNLITLNDHNNFEEEDVFDHIN